MSGLPAANPASAFYASSRSAQWLGRGLRLAQALTPAWGTSLALRLFFTPLPLKWVARRQAVPAPWAVEHWPFERGAIAAYRRSDVPHGRPTVLLIHGWAGDALQMLALGDALAADGVNPVLLDFPGHGRSQAWQSTLPQFARAIWAASARLGPLHAVVAHSLGAVATSHAAASGLPVERLALLAPAASPSLFMTWFAGSFGLDAALPGRMRAVIERREGVLLDHYEPAWLGPRVVQPTLVVHDEGDRVAPFTVGQRWAKAFVGARLVATQGLGHRRLLADDAVVRAVQDHLRL
jgi:pimeloyl-ACP methyl ester carboxylesterase